MKMKRQCWPHVALLGAGMILVNALPGYAQEWREQTILKFSEPVMVPGATLPPGSYEFRLLDSDSNRHMVRITTEDGSKVYATTQAVPLKRLDAKGDVVLKFNPTDTETPPALKAWFYPGTVYGHEFIYPEEQAKQIAERTKTIVLSTDVSGTDLRKGTLRSFQPSGAVVEWKADPATMREWDQWEKKRQATAPIAAGDFEGKRIALDDLEENPSKYTGQTVSVDAEVEEVFGPRLFTIDEPNWGDLDGELLVYMPSTLAALVQDDDRVTITGTVKTYVRADVENEWGWLGLEPDAEVEFAKKPVLVASRIVGGDDNFAMVVDLGAARDTARAGRADAGDKERAGPITNLTQIAGGRETLVGRHVQLDAVKVDAVAKDGGFFVSANNAHLFVLPAMEGASAIEAGDMVKVSGVVFQMPRHMKSRLNAPESSNDDIYVYATSVTETSVTQ
jgi:hypothetical protein